MAEETVKKPQITDEVATIAKDIDIFYGWIKRLENPDPVLRSEAAGKGLKLYDEVDRDAHAGSVLQQRNLAVVGKEWEIIPAKSARKLGRPASTTQEEIVADYVSDVLENCNFDQARQEILKAVLYGFCSIEVIWNATKDGIKIKKLIAKHPRRFSFTMDRELRLITPSNMIEGEPVPDRKFVIFTYGDSDNPYGRGLGQRLWWPVWFKKNGVKFWLVFLEKFGMPTVKGKYPPGTTPEQQQKLMDAIEAIQSDTGIKIPDSMDIEFLEASRAGTVTHEQLCEYMDRQISKAVLGQTASTEGTPGKLGNEKTQGDVRQEIIEADSDLLDACLNETLIKWIVDYNFPDVSAYPKIVTYARPKPDLTAQIAIDKTAVVDIGVPIPLRYFYETYGWPVPAEGEDVAVKRQPLPRITQSKQGNAFAELDVKKNTETSRAVTAQRALDALAERKISEAVPIFENYITEIKQYLDESGTLEAARDNIVSLYDRLDSTPLARSLREALAEADDIGGQSIGPVNLAFAEASWGPGKPFQEQMDFFNAKAFTISGVGKADLVAGVKDALSTSIEKGTSMEKFRADVNALFTQHGYDKLSPWRIETIYRTNMQSSYQAARYRQMTDPAVIAARPYWRYVAVLDSHTRPAHYALNGKIFRYDHPFWQTWYPPNGFNCRCTVVNVSQTEMDREGWTVETEDPTGKLFEPVDPVTGNKLMARPLMPDQGWGEKGGSLERVYKGKAAAGEKGAVQWKEVKGQPGPVELGRPKENAILEQYWKQAPEKVQSLEALIDNGMDETAAFLTIEREYRKIMGISPNESFAVLRGPDGEIATADMTGLAHAMLNRADRRERYVAYFRSAIEAPYEILLTEYETSAGKTKFRKKYIGLYKEPKEAVVVIGEISPEGTLLWNVMNARKGTIDRQRRGVKVLYGE